MIDDAGEDWVFPQKFDFIHARQLHCAVEEKRLIEQALQYFTLPYPMLILIPSSSPSYHP